GWDGARPRLMLSDVVLHDPGGQPALKLGRMENSLSWWSLLSGQLQFHTIEITAPDLNVRRDARAVIHVAGIALRGGSGEPSVAQWVLEQRRIVIRDARLQWHDEARGAPPLALENVQLRLENTGRRHRFALRASAPSHLAGTLDLRGDISGTRWDDAGDWSGQVYAELDYADLGGWRTWIDYPLELARGTGAMRVWLSFAGTALREVTADLRLRGVRARLGQGLPELDMPGLHGRLGWKSLAGGYELSTEDLSLTTRAGAALRPTDFLYRTTAPPGESGGGELRANQLDLGALVALSAYLPLEATVREQLVAFSPGGTASDLTVKWTGHWPTPLSYSAKGRFSDLALRRHRGIPGFTGLTGNLDGNDRGGTFAIDARRASLDLPGVFREPLVLDSLTAQASWTRRGREFELKLGSVAFANPHAAGSLFGTYRGAAGSAGHIDLSGNLTRADARFVGRYIPLAVSAVARDWLDQAFLAGTGTDVRLRLKGDLEQFPFPDGRDGLFEVTAKIAGGTLRFAEGWPKVENIRGDLAFRGQRMEALVDQAGMLGARLSGVRAEIPDLTANDPALVVQGDAEGPTSEFLRFVEASPVDEHVGGFTRGMRATGSGKLALRMRMPLDRTEETRLAGSFRFLGNRLDMGPEAPVLEQLNGVLDFTGDTVSVRDASAQVLGGPATIGVATQRDGSVRVSASGRVTGDGLRRALQHPAVSLVRGAADWRSSITLRRGQVEWSVDSSLQGLALDLPAPLAKAAAETLPLRIERRPVEGQRQVLNGNLGSILSWSLLQGPRGSRETVERGAVSFGGSAVLPDRKGLWVYGTVGTLDLDQWRALLASKAPGAGEGLALAGLNVRAGRLEVLGKRFSDLQVSATQKGGVWQARMTGPEADGDVQWRSQGAGSVTARFRHFIVPPDAPVKPGGAAAMAQNQELPALDIAVDSFGIRDKQLGRLELLAQTRDRHWKIERLKITNPESTFQATGQVQREPQRTQLNLTLDVVDAGKLLGRLGFPGTVKWGNGKLEGNLSWAGPAHAIDYPTLGGDLRLEAFSGQFLKIEPGAGKLLGILSLQALPRRLLFDFRDVVDSGFEFDTINATATISRGVLNTKDFVMVGSSAQVIMRGDINLAAETQDLRVRIAPALSEGVSLAGSVLGGPVVGAAALFVSKALKDPIGQLAAVEYNVKGTWADPLVTKAGATPPPAVPSPLAPPGIPAPPASPRPE
ncbi:MAG TPA: YhdP family protein, partial [Burkholderiales bacterium]|nr:YhdP family protein [Burkholderiales bacterium]